MERGRPLNEFPMLGLGILDFHQSAPLKEACPDLYSSCDCLPTLPSICNGGSQAHLSPTLPYYLYSSWVLGSPTSPRQRTEWSILGHINFALRHTLFPFHQKGSLERLGLFGPGITSHATTVQLDSMLIIIHFRTREPCMGWREPWAGNQDMAACLPVALVRTLMTIGQCSLWTTERTLMSLLNKGAHGSPSSIPPQPDKTFWCWMPSTLHFYNALRIGTCSRFGSPYLKTQQLGICHVLFLL